MNRRMAVAGVAVLGWLFLCAPLQASPILVTGTYSLYFDGNDGGEGAGMATGQEVSGSASGPISGSFSESISQSIPLPPSHSLAGSAAVTLSISPHQIELLGSTSTSYPGGRDYPYASVGSDVSVMIDFELSSPHVVSGWADFDVGSGASNGGSYVSMSGLPAAVNYDWWRSGLEFGGVLPAGTYSAYANAFGGGTPGEGGGGGDFSLSLSLIPVTEPSTLLTIAIASALLLGSQRRQRAHSR